MKKTSAIRNSDHPGEVLADALQKAGTSPSELARQICVPANRVTQIIHGRRGITGDTALRLGHWFQTTPEYWLNLQNAYEIHIAVQKAGKEINRLPVRSAHPDDARLKGSE